MAQPTETPLDPDMRAGMEELIAAMKDRRPATDAEASGLEPVPTRESDGKLAAAPWHAIRPAGRSDEPAVSEQQEVLAQGTVIDRYVILKQLGAGGMGVVYAAYDPELDRKVALKLLRAGVGDEQGRARLLREAQALGKLAHPNIVAVHDVGTVGEQVWLAMEFVQGRTLREWLRQRVGWREVVRVMRSAGKGLAAAHAAGLLHRDFKPDNVMIGDDGRVRVMDFGLARVGPEGVTSEPEHAEQPAAETLAMQLTAAGAIVGTPSYMAPEQLEDRELTAAADQFAFCVTLWEALYGERPFEGRTMLELVANVLGGRRRPPPKDRAAPSRLRRACERGLALDPRQRWPSMEALLAELRRLATPGRRWLALGLAGGLATLGGGVALARYVEVMDRCTGARAELDGVWDETKRREVEAAILGTELVYAPDTWERVEQRLDGYADAWASKHTEVCEATRVTAAQTEAVMELRMGCLRGQRTALRAAVQVLGQADAEVVEKAVELVGGLPRLERCDDVERLEQQRQRVPPPEDPDVALEVETLREQLADIRAEQNAGKHAHALDQVERVVERAQVLGYAPLLAEARYRRGMLLEETGKFADAENDLKDAYALALEHEHDDVALDSAQGLTFVVGDRQARHAEGLVWVQTALALAERQHDDVELASGLDDLAIVLYHKGEYEQAKLHFQRALRIRQATLGTDHLLVARTLNGLGFVFASQGDYEQAELHARRSLQIREQALGPDHPDLAHSLSSLATVYFHQGNYEQAKLHDRRALEIREAALGADHPDLASGLLNLGIAFASEGEYAQAEQYFRRALQIQEEALGPDHPDVARGLTNMGNVAFHQGNYEQAELHHRRALRIWEKAVGPDHPDLANSSSNLANALSRQGDREQAQLHHQRALRIWEKALGPDHPSVATSLHNLGTLFERQGQYEQAEDHFRRALMIREKALDPDHPDVASTANNLGFVLFRQGDHEQAELHHRRALQTWEKALGPEHSHVAEALAGLAEVALVQKQLDAARAHAERAVSIHETKEQTPEALAEARFLLARILWSDRAARPRARALAEQAREAFAEHGKGREGDLADVEAWLTEHRSASSRAR